MQIRISCPQCGGEIVFDEELEVVCCPYCASTMQISGKAGRLCFMLAPRWSAAECSERVLSLLGSKKSLRLKKRRLQLLYAPYWRSKGMVFHWVFGKKTSFSRENGRRNWDDFKKLKTKAFDFSFPAYNNLSLGLESLGVRTAALQLLLYHPSRLSPTDLVLRPQTSLEEAVQRSNAYLTFGFADSSLKVEIQDTQLVGETYSLIYFPFWLLEVGAGRSTGVLVIDGLANRVSKTFWQQDLTTLLGSEVFQPEATGFDTLKLMPNRCPVCGWDLPLLSRSKVHVCLTCTRAWTERLGRYREVDYQMVSIESEWRKSVRYLPFWNLEAPVRLADHILRTRADLGRLAPAITAGSRAQGARDPISFFIPAFKISNMHSLCKLATTFFMRPPRAGLRAKEGLEKQRFEAVSLSDREAAEMARVVLFSIVPRYNRRARRLLKDAQVQSAKPRLVYYPFSRSGLYFREVNSNHGIQYGVVARGLSE